MFFNTAVVSGLTLSEGEYLSSQIFFFGTSSNKAQSNAINTIDSGIVQSVGNFQVVLNAFFSPNRFKFFFGNNATQSVNSIIIQKSNLTGLNPSANNTAESLLVAILSKILFGLNINFPGISFTYWGYVIGKGKRTDTILIDTRDKLTPINTYELPEVSTIVDPNNY